MYVCMWGGCCIWMYAFFTLILLGVHTVSAFLDVGKEEHNYRSLASGMWQATERILLLSVVASAYTHSPQGVNSRRPGL